MRNFYTVTTERAGACDTLKYSGLHSVRLALTALGSPSHPKRRHGVTVTIKRNGATLNKSGEIVNFRSGYQVSKRDCYTLNAENINEILTAISSLLKTVKPSEFVGLWVDSGLIYIDISERVERLSAAIVAGIERKQKSIFNWCMSRCIGLEG